MPLSIQILIFGHHSPAIPASSSIDCMLASPPSGAGSRSTAPSKASRCGGVLERPVAPSAALWVGPVAPSSSPLWVVSSRPPLSSSPAPAPDPACVPPPPLAARPPTGAVCGGGGGGVGGVVGGNGLSWLGGGWCAGEEEGRAKSERGEQTRTQALATLSPYLRSRTRPPSFALSMPLVVPPRALLLRPLVSWRRYVKRLSHLSSREFLPGSPASGCVGQGGIRHG